MNEVDPELLAEFVSEAQDHLAVLESELLVMEKELGGTSAESLNRIFRSVHSIKGTAGFLGFQNIVTLSHVMETLFDRFRKGTAVPNREAVGLLFEATDDLVKMVNDLGSEGGYDVSGRVAAIEMLLKRGMGSESGEKNGPSKGSRKGKKTRGKRKKEEPEGGEETVGAEEMRAEGVAGGAREEIGGESPLPGNYRFRYEVRIEDLEAFERMIGLTPVRLFRVLEGVGFVADSRLEVPAGGIRGGGLRKALPLRILFYSDKTAGDLEAATEIPDFYFCAVEKAGPGDEGGRSEVEGGEGGVGGGRGMVGSEGEGEGEGVGRKEMVADDGLDVEGLFRGEVEGGEVGGGSSSEDGERGMGREGRGKNGEEMLGKEGMGMGTRGGVGQGVGSGTDMVRVPSRKLDHLVNLVGEMVILHAQLAAATRKIAVGNPELQSTIEGIERLGAELRDTVLNIRMMPVGTTFQKYHRLVRDLCRELGKEAVLVIEGGETELDKTVLDQLGDPLTHILRNSVDHGLEKPEERIAVGKPASGTIRLAAEHRGERVVIRISDDGQGLNTEKIRQKAIERGLISAEARLAEQEIWGLIFEPGFSTAQKVTGISGRGVGMDVVKKKIQGLGGEVSLQSERGKGTEILLSLPLTLAIIDGLMVEVDGDRLIIPLSIVSETIELRREERFRHNARNVVDLRGHPIPYLRLRELFGYGDGGAAIEPIVIVEHQGQRIGLVVDRVIGNHQTVLKSLGRLCRNVAFFSGATILGDGTVALVLDVGGILRVHRSSIDPRTTLEV